MLGYAGEPLIERNAEGRPKDERWRMAAALASGLAAVLAITTASLAMDGRLLRAEQQQRDAAAQVQLLELSRMREQVAQYKRESLAARSVAAAAQSAPQQHQPALAPALAPAVETTQSANSPIIKATKHKPNPVDPATPKEARDKYKSRGLSLMFSDEFKDLKRTEEFFVFEDVPCE